MTDRLPTIGFDRSRPGGWVTARPSARRAQRVADRPAARAVTSAALNPPQ
jgi:hypothetical protein